MSDIYINLPGPSAGHKGTRVSLDSIDITEALVRVQLDASARELTTVTLHLDMPEVTVNGQARVEIPSFTRRVLEQLGWKPPQPILGGRLGEPIEGDPA